MTQKERRLQIKARAKKQLKQSSSNPYLATLVFGLINFLMLIIFEVYMVCALGLSNFLGNEDYIGLNVYTAFQIIISIISLLLMNGFMWYCLKVYRGEQNSIKDIFNGFSKKGLKLFLITLIEGLLSFIVMIILCVPMFIILFITEDNSAIFLIVFLLIYALMFIALLYVSYSFRMTCYIIYDNDLGIIDTIKLSFKMMKGHKWELFKLDMTLIGWVLLILITFYIAGIYVFPYMWTVNAGFYEELKNENNAETINGEIIEKL